LLYKDVKDRHCPFTAYTLRTYAGELTGYADKIATRDPIVAFNQEVEIEAIGRCAKVKGVILKAGTPALLF
jgi:hypothetical protein